MKAYWLMFVFGACAGVGGTILGLTAVILIHSM
jgi:hypothetical protein